MLIKWEFWNSKLIYEWKLIDAEEIKMRIFINFYILFLLFSCFAFYSKYAFHHLALIVFLRFFYEKYNSCILSRGNKMSTVSYIFSQIRICRKSREWLFEYLKDLIFLTSRIFWISPHPLIFDSITNVWFNWSSVLWHEVIHFWQ